MSFPKNQKEVLLFKGKFEPRLIQYLNKKQIQEEQILFLIQPFLWATMDPSLFKIQSSFHPFLEQKPSFSSWIVNMDPFLRQYSVSIHPF
jgi:hypothetical protein